MHIMRLSEYIRGQSACNVAIRVYMRTECTQRGYTSVYEYRKVMVRREVVWSVFPPVSGDGRVFTRIGTVKRILSGHGCEIEVVVPLV